MHVFPCLLILIGYEERRGKEDVLKFLPGVNYSCNSEGDFIIIRNGKILFIYSRFSRTFGSDFGSAYLASHCI